MAGRIEVPRAISEAPTDRIFVSVELDGQLRQIVGARAPTVGQGAAAEWYPLPLGLHDGRSQPRRQSADHDPDCYAGHGRHPDP